MFKFENFSDQQVKDFRDAHFQANPAQYPFYALLNAKNKFEKATSINVSEKVEKLDSYNSNSGGKEEGANWAETDGVKYEYVENICEIFSETVKVSNTAKAVSEANYKNEYKKQLKQRNTMIGKNIDNALLNGTIKKTGGRKMAGLASLATKVAGTLTEETLDKAMLHLYTQGYTGDVYLLINPANKKALDKIILDNKMVITINNGMRDTVGVSITSFMSTYGFTVNILLDGHVPADTAFLVDIDPIKLKHLRKIQVHELPALGDYEGGTLVTELSLITSKLNTVIIKQ